MNGKDVDFKYALVEQKEFCIVTFTGAMSQKPKESLKECLEKIELSCCKYFILNFKDVTAIQQTAHRFIVQLQQLIRSEKKCKLKLCNINPKWKRTLIDDGIIKSSELYAHPKLAISDFIKEAAHKSNK